MIVALTINGSFVYYFSIPIHDYCVLFPRLIDIIFFSFLIFSRFFFLFLFLFLF